MKELIAKYQKSAEKTTNKIRLPKLVIDKFGNKFYMEVYSDMIVLKPIKEGE